MNILQRILKTTQKEAHPTVEELKTSIQKMEEDLQSLRAELEKSLLSLEALEKKEESPTRPLAAGQETAPTKTQTEQGIGVLKDSISELEVQVRVLRARVMVSSTTNTIKKQMAQLSSMGSVTLLENQKEKEATRGERPSSGDSTGTPQKPNQEPGQPLAACTPQAFTPKADALQEKSGLTPNGPESAAERP
ncbi:hypothetical protein [Rufibacter sp. XAAS-G3-1]|uniref:hypothetical protein n=1 Tax=Rufibacter sp. XAAS-G3-1 TaxID=2729134 RepID=UPI0015E71467|nr:hypothetical protein [Rufibacter sp. XAAS-G3-1]